MRCCTKGLLYNCSPVRRCYTKSDQYVLWLSEGLLERLFYTRIVTQQIQARKLSCKEFDAEIVEVALVGLKNALSPPPA